jgi:hypothetical protein
VPESERGAAVLARRLFRASRQQQLPQEGFRRRIHAYLRPFARSPSLNPTADAFLTVLVAGIVGQKLVAKLWSQVFDEEVPDTAQQEVALVPLLGAAVLEGTMYKLLRMAADRGLRDAVIRLGGTWPGEAGEGE